MTLAEQILVSISDIERKYDNKYVPEDKYHDDRYLTELLASETKFAILHIS